LTAPSFDDAFQGRLEELLRWRRDVRYFRPDPVAQEDMLRLLELACLSPSVGNSQPWRFVRVRSPRLRARLAEHADAEIARSAAQYARDEQRDHYLSLKLHGIAEAPELIAVFSDEQPAAGHGLGIATMPESLRYSTVTAIHSLWLAARACAIGIGWVSILDPRIVRQMLAVPREWTLIALLCMGYPADQSDIPELEQRGWQERHASVGKIFER
jgi:5,6-dimethylbenzimidazole synthase